MRSKTLLVVTSFALACGAAGPASAATVHTAQIIDFGYRPDPLHVVAGDSVRWQNVAPNVDHTATVFATASNPFSFDTGAIGSGATSAAIVMTTPGTFTVLCVFHGTLMRQQLVVDSSLPVDVPEAPVAVLVGLSGFVLLCGVYLVKQRHQRAATN